MTKNLRNFIFFFCIGMLASLQASTFTDWVEFPVGSPVYNPPFPVTSLDDDYFPCVIFNENKFDGNGNAVFYKMWHQGPNNAGNTTSSLAYSTSNDGINWTLVNSAAITDVPPTPFHPTVIYDKNGFGGGPYHYKMWYWFGNVIGFTPPFLAINFTQSVDGITWTTPVATTQDTTSFLANAAMPGQLFYQFYGFGTVLYNPKATSTPGQPYTFPYVAFFDSSAAESPPQTTEEAVGLAYSHDGLFWTRFGSEPVLLPSGNEADWDGEFAYRASVIQLDGTYHMFYSGASGSNNPNPAFEYTYGIGHASSIDGINWVKDSGNPIFTINDPAETWRSGRTLAPTVVVSSTRAKHCACCHSSLLQMWFSGGTNSGSSFATAAIGYATLNIREKEVDKMWLKIK